MTMNHDAKKTGRHTSSATKAADPNLRTFKFVEMAQKIKLAGICRKRTYNASKSLDSFVITISTEKLRSLIQIKVKSAVDAAQRDEKGSMSRNLVEETICNVLATRPCAANKGFQSSFFSVLENKITKIIFCEVLKRTLNESTNCWPWFNTFEQAIVERIANNPSFIMPVVAFGRKSVISAMEGVLKEKSKLLEELHSFHDSSPSAFT